MRQSITTKYLGPTDYRGSRIKATAQAGSVTLSWDHALSSLQNHAEAARALALTYGWDGIWVMGGNAEGGYNFILQAAESFAFELGDTTSRSPEGAA